MKFLAIAAVLFAVALCSRPAIDKAVIDAVNNHPEATWKAGINEKFIGMTEDEVKAMLGLHINTEQEARAAQIAMPNPHAFEERMSAIPDTFDARQQWPNCIHPIRNQEQCGSCWAFGSSEALSDRFCIQSSGATNVVLSPQWLVSCDQTNMGCNGGNLAAVWQYLASTGTTSDQCFPYASGNGTAPECITQCADGSPLKMYQAKSAYSVSGIFPFGRVAKIQTEIMNHGPVETGFQVYQDFINYKSGVYQHTSGNLLGGHAVKIIGWGVDNNTPYWLVANSWSATWGENGFFKIRRGDNQCGIEADVYAGLAKV